MTKKIIKNIFDTHFSQFFHPATLVSTHIKISSQQRLLECFRMTLVGLAARKLAQKKRLVAFKKYPSRLFCCNLRIL